SRQSVNPPVEAPTSSARRPATSIWSASSALASLIPPRETNWAGVSMLSSMSCSTSCPGLDARARPAPTCTWPASTAAAARDREANSPRSASRLSRRTRGTAQNGNEGATVTERTVRSGPESDDVGVMLRRLSLPEHGAVELVVGLGLIAAPLLLGFGPAGLLASMAAGAILVALGLMAMSVALAGGGERAAGGLLAAAAASELALSLGTRWTRRA